MRRDCAIFFIELAMQLADGAGWGGIKFSTFHLLFVSHQNKENFSLCNVKKIFINLKISFELTVEQENIYDHLLIQ